MFVKKYHIVYNKFQPPIVMSYSTPRQRYTPHKTLREEWTYISVPDDDVVIAVRVAVTKVMKLLNDKDEPIRDQNTGLPSYFFQSTNVVKVLTNDEYKVEKQISDKDV